MSKIFIGEEIQKDFNYIIEDIVKKQKEILEKLQPKFSIFDSEKRKYKLKMLSLLYTTYLSTLGNMKDKDFSMDDLNMIKSLSLSEDKNDIFIQAINTFKNLNSIKEGPNKDLYEANMLQLEKKKSDLKLEKNKSEEKMKEENQQLKKEVCIFCMEDFEENDIINPQIMECKKYVHGKCFIDYIEVELNNNRFPIRCPLCPGKETHEINYKTILDCLLLYDKDNLAIKLENVSLNHLAQNNSEEITFCPTPGCSYICFFDKNGYHLNCPLCKKDYCLRCKTDWHFNSTCEEYQKLKKEDENDAKFEEYVKGSKFKQCPKCKRWVEKISGCDHIDCPCGTPFCYRCGKIKDLNIGHGCRNCNNYGLFGFPQNRNNNLFGNIFLNNQNNQGGGLFGNNNQGGGLFGNNNQGGGLFGNNNQGGNLIRNNNQGGNLIGNNNQGNSLFGNNNQGSSLF